MLCGTGGHARSLEHDLRVQERGLVILGNKRWLYQISESNFQSAEFWPGRAKWHRVVVPNFWFHIFGLFVEF